MCFQKRDLTIYSLPIPHKIRDILARQGIISLYPPQAEAVKPLFDGRNLVLSLPTASGKSLVAYLAIFNNVLLKGGKALYIVPLRSLAFEKYEELKKFSSHLSGIKVGLSVGDYTAKDEYLRNYHILVVTAEKADSLFRNRSLYYSEITTFIADEVHLLDDPSRGATLEVILTKILLRNPSAQIIALSATIPNAEEIAEWLDAELIYSNWRPVELKKGVLSGRTIFFEDETKKEIENHLKKNRSGANREENIINLVLDTLKRGKQILIFQNTRKSAQDFSKKLGRYVAEHLSEEEKVILKNLSQELKESQLESVPMVEDLSRIVLNGTGFHHAGLTNSQRKLVENAFLKGHLKALCATPTLAAGVNLPAYRVVIKSIYRYGEFGMMPISSLEIQQMLGRAGRPKYDSYGEGLILPLQKKDVKKTMEEVLKKKPQNIISKLFLESNLRMHILGFIVENYARTRNELEEVLSKTFLAYQGGDYQKNLRKVLVFLKENGLIETDKEELKDIFPEDEISSTHFTSALKLSKIFDETEKEDYHIKPTEFGYKTARLYIDPYSAVVFKNALRYLKMKKEFEEKELFYLQTICRATEMMNLFLKGGEFEYFFQIAFEREKEIFFPLEKPKTRTDLEWFLSELKTALLLEDWVKEKKEKDITEKYGVGPGDIRNRVEIARWLLAAMYEISKMKEINLNLPILRDLVHRMEFGIKAELLPLVEIKGIGRVRARVLFEAGYRKIEDIKFASVDDLSRLSGFGEKMAEKIIKEAATLSSHTNI